MRGPGRVLTRLPPAMPTDSSRLNAGKGEAATTEGVYVKQYRGVTPTGTEVLVTVWDSTAEVAYRLPGSPTWGPPLVLTVTP